MSIEIEKCSPEFTNPYFDLMFENVNQLIKSTQHI